MGEVELECPQCIGEVLENADSGADDFGPDAVAGDGRDAVCFGRHVWYKEREMEVGSLSGVKRWGEINLSTG